MQVYTRRDKTVILSQRKQREKSQGCCIVLQEDLCSDFLSGPMPSWGQRLSGMFKWNQNKEMTLESRTSFSKTKSLSLVILTFGIRVT